MSVRTDLSPIYSLRPGYASKRTAVESVLRLDGMAARWYPWAIAGMTLLLLTVAVTFSLLGFIAAPIIAGVWHERRMRRMAARVRRQRLCLGCGYHLIDARLENDQGTCPECGRRFHTCAYTGVARKDYA